MAHWSGADSVDATPEMLTMPADAHTVIIDYVGLSLLQPGRVAYRYSMEGLDPDWVSAGQRRSATYTNLSPGEYTFRVTARNNHGVWNDEGASIRILVPARWWQTSWFFAMAVIGVVALAVTAHTTRTRWLRGRTVLLRKEIAARESAELELKSLGRRMISAQEDDRARIARDLHDDISQRLHGASIGIEVALRTAATNPDHTAERLGLVQTQLDEVAEDARSMSHELHPATLELLGITAALEGLCEDFESKYGVAVQVSVAESVQQEVSAEMALCLFRIAQEALRNVAKHADASEAALELSVRKEHALLRIRDNGAGFDPAAKRAGLGLASMRERARLLNGTVTLDSAPGGGTELLVDIPV